MPAKKSYSISFKLKVTEYAVKHGNHAAAKHFEVDRHRVIEWRQQKDKLEKMEKSKRRLAGGGRKVRYGDIEETLLKWFRERRDAGVRVTGKAMKMEAIRLHKAYGNQSFKASAMWFSRFKRRHNLSFRRSTHISQKSREVTDVRIDSFIKFVLSMRKRRHYSTSDMGNMDETPVWLEMPGKSTLNEAGKKEISVSSTGHEKKRYTVLLAALADGTKLTPLVLLPGVRPPPTASVPAGIAIYMCGTGKSWANEDVINYWLAKIWGRNNTRRRLLVWDSFKGHITDNIKQKVREVFNSDLAVIPGGCTSKLQPADVSWNGPFKKALASLYDEWVFSGPVSLTKGGNRRPPDVATLLGWIKQAWQSVTPDVVRKSFKVCGISNEMDGSEDHLLFQEDSDDDDPFEGFSAEDHAIAAEISANMTANTENIGEISEDSDDSSGDSGSDTDCYDYDSPGH